MCGRFSLNTSAERLKSQLSLSIGIAMSPRYNIAPTQIVPLIKTPGVLEFLRWGWVPAWAGLSMQNTGLINAKSETVTEKPAFKHAFQKRRCIIIADGYYEWKPVGRIKQPYYIRRKDNQLFGFAGLWTDDACVLLTTSANALLAPVSARMPVILDPAQFQTWLTAKTPIAQTLLCGYPSELLTLYPVSNKMNDPQFEGIECIRSLH